MVLNAKLLCRSYYEIVAHFFKCLVQWRLTNNLKVVKPGTNQKNTDAVEDGKDFNSAIQFVGFQTWHKAEEQQGRWGKREPKELWRRRRARWLAVRTQSCSPPVSTPFQRKIRLLVFWWFEMFFFFSTTHSVVIDLSRAFIDAKAPSISTGWMARLVPEMGIRLVSLRIKIYG